MRAFLGIPADPAWVESGRRLVETLRPRLPSASWTRPESWHVTVTFLGEITEEQADHFCAAIEPCARSLGEGDLIATGAALFPSSRRPRVAGVGFRPGPTLAALDRLAEAAEVAGRAIGYHGDGRAFHPHVTLARLREPWPAGAVAAFAEVAASWTFPPWRVTSCVLYRSLLDPAGAVHTPVRRWEAPAATEARP